MPLLTDSPLRMPVHLPTAECIRRQIAESAAALGGEPVDHYLAVLGAVEPIWPSARGESPWRLSGYIGAYQDGVAIERATAIVRRDCPLLRA
jgi:hypothetical protein